MLAVCLANTVQRWLVLQTLVRLHDVGIALTGKRWADLIPSTKLLTLIHGYN